MGNDVILVTGGAGFIGSSLIDLLLERGHKIICFDNFEPYYDPAIKRDNIKEALKNPDYSLFEGDIREPGHLENCFSKYKPDLVIHLAAKAGVRPSIIDPVGYYTSNVIGTLNLLEAMKKNQIKKLIFASSSSVYGNNTKIPFSETDPVGNPISPYAASKIAGELLCSTYHNLYDFDIFCLRFFTVYGPRQRPDLAINKFTDLALRNLEIPLYGDGSTSRDYTYIEDILNGIVSSIQCLRGFEIINLGESKTISLQKMVLALEEALQRPLKTGFYPKQQGDLESTYADIEKARTLLNYNPVWDFSNGLKKFIDWKRSYII